MRKKQVIFDCLLTFKNRMKDSKNDKLLRKGIDEDFFSVRIQKSSYLQIQNNKEVCISRFAGINIKINE